MTVIEDLLKNHPRPWSVYERPMNAVTPHSIEVHDANGQLVAITGMYSTGAGLSRIFSFKQTARGLVALVNYYHTYEHAD